MYRVCDLVGLKDESKTLRHNVTEHNAVEGLAMRFSDTPGEWKIKRVHGYSTLPD